MQSINVAWRRFMISILIESCRIATAICLRSVGCTSQHAVDPSRCKRNRFDQCVTLNATRWSVTGPKPSFWETQVMAQVPSRSPLHGLADGCDGWIMFHQCTTCDQRGDVRQLSQNLPFDSKADDADGAGRQAVLPFAKDTLAFFACTGGILGFTARSTTVVRNLHLDITSSGHSQSSTLNAHCGCVVLCGSKVAKSAAVLIGAVF
ncbi:uncharacterized protein BDR25DRAFT_87278 [Lindgomyces ingoldianus]|uniref:Uncharacterized protein n=1 Tax=Lindgomyces ingoldianus TaxID=673940 RepID=A0ACB6R8P2_9PLEO|nr:uncharacterized protein BDR25DRAFT_87278 [Lindgomyces ingoldianus]KAF2475634.1 hypothetical protein BDR25DRAFT_87278 [Lindgomyces ingoldianus]